MAGEVFFYHMTRTPLEATLPVLLSKSLEAGWRVAVRGADRESLERLDNLLWQGDESFVPHGMAGGPHDADQPVLLTMDKTAANAPEALIAVDGADVDPDEVAPFARVSILFNGNDREAVDRARTQWKAMTGAGVSAQYWSQESGKWEKKAEA